ncbi:hypothetical protein C8F01DRAFT_1126184 [Mycena amicta]|nr:hypothetical protein C8F01DRAFT_1126184 [Mycena amicta]
MCDCHTFPPRLSSRQSLAMQSAAAELRLRLDVLDSGISTVAAQNSSDLPTLIAERKALALEINAVASGFPLPFEIIAEIFTLHILDDPSHLRHPARQLRLASVCSSWRDVCFSLGHLWTRLNIYPCPELLVSQDHDCLIQMVITWLSRAGNHLIRLRIDSKLPWHIIDRIASTALSRFSGQLSRLDMPVPDIFPPAVVLPDGLPQLESIRLTFRYFGGGPGERLFGDAPLLRRVQLDGGRFTNMRLPYPQLTELVLTKATHNSAAAVLAHCTQLQKLSIEFRHSLDVVTDKITLPHLHTLRISSRNGDSLRAFRALPSLTSLDLNDLRLSPGLILPLARESQWSLRTVRFVSVPSRAVTSILSALVMGSIKELDLVVPFNDLGFSTFVAHLSRANEFLPNLRSMRIKTCPASEGAALEELVEAVHDRCRRSSMLEYLSLNFDKRVGWEARTEGILSKFRPLAEDGLELVIEGLPLVVADGIPETHQSVLHR